MRPGTLIDYRITVHGLPIRWRTEIAEWDPPHQFVDVQRCGPYTSWHHTHSFEDSHSGTLCRDRVRYRPGGGTLIHWLFVRHDVERIFEYRQQRLREALPALPVQPPEGARRTDAMDVEAQIIDAPEPRRCRDRKRERSLRFPKWADCTIATNVWLPEVAIHRPGASSSPGPLPFIDVNRFHFRRSVPEDRPGICTSVVPPLPAVKLDGREEIPALGVFGAGSHFDATH